MKTNFNTCLMITFFIILAYPKAFSTPLAVSTGELFGYVKDSISHEPLAYAVVVVKNGDAVISGATTDEKGTYKISGINPGTYTVQASYANYAINKVTGVIISAEQTTRLDFTLSSNTLEPVIKIIYRIPLVDPQEVSTSFTMTQEDLIESPYLHNITDIAAQAPGVFQRDAGQPFNVRGTRESATAYIVDGVRITGNPAVPAGAIEQMTVITGGIPAQYGDATGGFVIITTKSYFSH